jgi:hypothetical protein
MLRGKKTKTLIILATALLLLTVYAAAIVKAEDTQQTAKIWTDKTDYSPEETVTIYGEGFNGTVTLTVVRPDGSINDPEHGIVGEWTVEADENGKFQTTYQLDGILGTYTVTATDENGNKATTTFTDKYHISTVSVGAQSPASVQPGESATFGISSTWTGSGQSENASLSIISWSPSPPAGLTLTFNPDSINQSSSTSVLIIGTSQSTPSGTYTFTVKAYEDQGHQPTATGTLVVQKVNQPPVLDPIGSKTVDEETLLTFTATASDPDIPANTLTFSLIDAPAGASIDDSTGAFTWTPSEAQGPGSYTFKVRVTDDGGLYDEEEITVTVNEVNKPPVLDPIGSKEIPWGETLSFTATASDPDIPANTLTFSLIDAPAGASIDGSTGVFTWTPTSSQIGTHKFKVKVTDDGSPDLSAEEEITVTVAKRDTTLVYSGDASGQYSDPVTVTATLTDALTGDPIADKTITFTIGTQSKTATTIGTGVASTSITLTQPAGSYTVTSVFAGDSLYLPSSDSKTFTINKETATIVYTGDIYVLTAGPSITTAPVRLSATVTQESDGSPGNLALAKVKFTLTPDNGPPIVVGNVPVNSAGEALATVNVPVGSYDITIDIEPENLYWKSDVDVSTVTVYTGTGKQMVTGGGWIPYAESTNGKINFGFTVQYDKNGAPKGSFVAVFRSTDGYIYKIKSTSWSKGGLSFTAVNKAFFTATCVVQKIDSATGEVVESWGNYKIMVDITDSDYSLPQNGRADTIAIAVLDNDFVVWRQFGTSTDQIKLGGGNIVVHSK